MPKEEQHDIENEASKIASKTDVLKVIGQLTKLKAESAEINGSIGQIVQQAEDKKNIHRGALKFAAKIKRMDTAKAQEFLAHAAAYLHYIGYDELRDLFDKKPRLVHSSDKDEHRAQA